MGFESFLIGITIFVVIVIFFYLILLINDDYESVDTITELWKDLLDKVYWLFYKLFHWK